MEDFSFKFDVELIVSSVCFNWEWDYFCFVSFFLCPIIHHVSPYFLRVGEFARGELGMAWKSSVPISVAVTVDEWARSCSEKFRCKTWLDEQIRLELPSDSLGCWNNLNAVNRRISWPLQQKRKTSRCSSAAWWIELIFSGFWTKIQPRMQIDGQCKEQILLISEDEKEDQYHTPEDTSDREFPFNCSLREKKNNDEGKIIFTSNSQHYFASFRSSKCDSIDQWSSC